MGLDSFQRGPGDREPGDYALLQHVRELEDENDVNEPPRASGCAALILGTIAAAAVLFAISWAIVSLV